MADKSFALKVELQGDVERFKQNMAKAKAYSSGFAKGVEKAGSKAQKSFSGMTGGVNKLTGAIQAAGGGQGVGLLSQALTSLGSPAGVATAAIASVALGIRQARADMEKFEQTTDALNVGLSAFMESARIMRKEEKKSLRTGRINANLEIMRLQDELVGFRKELKKAEASGDTARVASLTADIQAHKNLIMEKDKLDREYAASRSHLGYVGFGKKEAQQEFAAANLELQKANRDAIFAKGEQSKIEREIMELSAVMAVNSEATNEQRLAAVEKTKELRKQLIDISDIKQKQIDAQKALNALGMNTLEDETKVTAMITEREKLLKKMVTSQKDMDTTLARIAKQEEAVTAEKAKQMALVLNMEKIAEKRRQGVQYSPGRGDSTQITYAGAGVFQGENYSQKMQDWYENQKMMLEDLNRLAEDYVSGSLANLASGFGEALVSGDMDSYLQGILRTFGSFMVQMGGMIMTYGVSMDAFKKAFSSPAAAIAAGATLAAVGGAIVGAANNFNASGSVGSSYGTSSYSTSEAQTVTFVLEGDKLKGAIDNSNRKLIRYR